MGPANSATSISSGAVKGMRECMEDDLSQSASESLKMFSQGPKLPLPSASQPVPSGALPQTGPPVMLGLGLGLDVLGLGLEEVFVFRVGVRVRFRVTVRS